METAKVGSVPTKTFVLFVNETYVSIETVAEGCIRKVELLNVTWSSPGPLFGGNVLIPLWAITTGAHIVISQRVQVLGGGPVTPCQKPGSSKFRLRGFEVMEVYTVCPCDKNEISRKTADKTRL